MVPHLTTALTGPLLDLERRFLENQTGIEQWLRAKWQEHTPPFYGSVDLRNAGFKLAPVDTNLFPGGFNNLNPAFMALCVQAAMTAVEKMCPEARNLLLVPENHTRNQFYLRNVARLAHILRLSGLNVRIGSLLPDLVEPMPVDTGDGGSLLLEPLKRLSGGRRLGLDGFDPCVVLLNNDLSAGVPELLQNLDEQFVIPPLHAGWTTRRKSTHFHAYSEVAAEFADFLGIDPWLIDPLHAVCGAINFHERTGEECLALKVDELLTRIREKYRQHGVTHDPFVIVKANSGTYGMGIMTVRDTSEVIGLNRKQRNKMSVVKEGLPVTEVMIQEGVPTFETVEGGVAEPVVYMIDRYVVGGFYRVHAERGTDENLNAPGMQFKPLAFESCCLMPDRGLNPDDAPNRFYAYGVVARLALLAASLELERTAPVDEALEAEARGVVVMRVAFIVDPLDQLKAYKDSSVAMMREAQLRGHEVWTLQREALCWDQGRVEAIAVAINLGEDDAHWYQPHLTQRLALTDFDAVVMRQDPPFDFEYVCATWLLERARAEGACIFNDPRAIRDHSEKIAITEFPQFIAPTLVARQAEDLDRFIDQHGDCVLKPLDGMGGSRVFRVGARDPNRNVIVETLTELGTRSIMAQRYLPAIREGDKRVLLIDGEPVPYALARIPKEGETRGNLAAGGRGEARALTEREREIAAVLGPVLRARGLLLVGLDVIGDCLTEINVTSPTCFVEITQQTGCNVAGLFIDALERAAAG